MKKIKAQNKKPKTPKPKRPNTILARARAEREAAAREREAYQRAQERLPPWARDTYAGPLLPGQRQEDDVEDDEPDDRTSKCAGRMVAILGALGCKGVR